MNARNERARCRSVSELMTVNVRYKLPDGSQSTHRGHERVLKRFTFYRLARSSVNPERATNAAGPQSIDLQDEN